MAGSVDVIDLERERLERARQLVRDTVAWYLAREWRTVPRPDAELDEVLAAQRAVWASGSPGLVVDESRLVEAWESW